MASKDVRDRNNRNADRELRAYKASVESNNRYYPMNRLSHEEQKILNRGIELGYNDLPLSEEDAKNELILNGYRIGQRRREAEIHENSKKR